MRFGTFVPQGWKSDLRDVATSEQWDHIVAMSRHIEDVGYDSLWVYDHFHTHPVVLDEPVFEAWTLMAALANVTETIRLGQMCTCALYRPPSLLAKMASTIDVMSGGRLDVGIGAGWSQLEFAAYGYDYPRDGVRLDVLEESVQVLLAMWGQGHGTFNGEIFQVEEAINLPRAIQEPHPPLWIAGGGEKRTLKMVAQFGDFSNYHAEINEFRHKSRVLAGHCEALGRDYNEIGRSGEFMAVIGTDQADLDAKLEIAAPRRSLTPAEFKEQHLAVLVNEAVDVVGELAEEGCSDLLLYFYDIGAADSLDVFASEVIPQFS